MHTSRRLLVLLVLLLQATSALAQVNWQQRVHYQMDVRLLADRHQIKGTQRLTYHNNSPDTLRKVYYHLYFNAFQPNSMMAERNRHLPDPDQRVVPRIFQLGPDQIGYQRVQSLRQDGTPVEYRIDDTVMEVRLAEPLLPGDSTVFDMVFQGQVPLQTRRSGRDNREGIDFSMSQWYPKMAAYDEKGWHADPYIGREFYAPYGTFDVRLRVPAAYTIGATGVLQNPEAVGHGYSDATPASDTLLWHFRADNVHDFAWAADPDYIHRQVEGPGGIRIHLLYQPEEAPGWERLAPLVPRLFEVFIEKFGPYQYPQFTIAQAGDGGMEYPMIIFITGRSGLNGLVSVVSHEAGHEWFYAMLGSNEIDHPWMDEGFTQYATMEGIAGLTGAPVGRHTSALFSIMTAKELGFFEPIGTRSDWFQTNSAYSVAAYSGGQAIADLLGYVVSDPVRDAFLQEYVRRYTFRHPQPEDVEKVAEDVSGLQLDWFFDQMLHRTEQLDYAVTDLASRPRSGGGWTTTVTLRRNTEFVMPVDLRLTTASGTAHWATIPLTEMRGAKPVPDGWTVAPAWPWTSTEYTFSIDTPERVTRAEIDPMLRLPDINRLNNSSRFPLSADFLRGPSPNWTSYSVGWRPQAMYSYFYGPSIGLQFRGGYIFDRHRTKGMVSVYPEVISSKKGLDWHEIPWYNGIDYSVQYASRAPWLGNRAEVALASERHLGIMETSIQATKPLRSYLRESRRRETLRVGVLHRFSSLTRGFVLPSGPSLGQEHLVFGTLGYGLSTRSIRLDLALETGGTVGVDPAVGTRVSGMLEGWKRMGRLTLSAKAFAGLGSDRLEQSSRFVLGSVSAAEAWRNPAFRTIAAATAGMNHQDHIIAMNGAGPVAHTANWIQSGSSVLSGNVSLSVQPLPRKLQALDMQVYAAAGRVWPTYLRDRGILWEAGPAIRLNVPGLRFLERWTAQSDVLQTFRLVARFPLLASRSDPFDENDLLEARWFVGIEL